MPPFPRTFTEIVQRAQADGWKLVRVAGSHHQFKKDGFREILTVPYSRKDLAPGTARRIAKIAGWV